MSLTNAERQKRFRQLTLKERQLKADALDWLVAALECDLVREDRLPLPDGRWLKLVRRDGEVAVQLVADAQTQSTIERARLRAIHGE